MTASVYIHVPFCDGVCDYCDFYSVPLAPAERAAVAARYIDRLLEDAAAARDFFALEKIPTVYLGGGTPSLLGGEGIGRLLQGLGKVFSTGFAPGGSREVTCEANPESADAFFLNAAREAGVTRLSLGVQTFHEPSRRAVGRRGPGGAALAARLALAAEVFGPALAVDLMSGLPYQDEAVLAGDIDRVTASGAGHVSLYALTLEEGRGFPGLPGADEASRLWIAGRDRLEAAGFSQYEVSNFCRPGRECRHNLRYWRMEDWIGLGPGASGTVGDRRYRVPPDAAAWLRGSRELEPEVEELDPRTRREERLLMGFRLRAPFFACPQAGALIPATLARWRRRGLMEGDALSREGLLFLNRFLSEAFLEL